MVVVAAVPSRRAASPSEACDRVSRWLRLALVLGKARVVGLVTFTAVVATVVAADGHPTIWSVLGVVLTGALAGGGAGAINHVLDRDLDRRMGRTRGRPVATGAVRAGPVLAAAGVSLGTGLVVAWSLGPAVALHTLVAAVTYVLIYTRLLKRHTPQSVVVGGWTGAAAVLAGWEAAGEPLSITALALAAVVFLWTPAHFWSLALLRLDDYRAAGVPALPVVAGPTVCVWFITASVAMTLAAAVLPILVGERGGLYTLGLVVVAVAWGLPSFRLLRSPDRIAAGRAFAISNLALFGLFGAALADSLTRSA